MGEKLEHKKMVNFDIMKVPKSVTIINLSFS